MLGYSYSGKLFKEDVGLVFTVTQHLISVSKVSLYLELFIDMLITHITRLFLSQTVGFGESGLFDGPTKRRMTKNCAELFTILFKIELLK